MAAVTEKYRLEGLTERTVSIIRQTYVTIDGQEEAAGLPQRNTFENCQRQRKLVRELLPEQYANAVFALWGDSPTVEENLLTDVVRQ